MGQPDVIVVGAGFGGLAAAIDIAAAGHRVLVIEAADQPGGKAGTVEIDGVRFDTGPSVLTLPHIPRELLAKASAELADRFVLRRPTPAFRYAFDDGVVIDTFHEVEATLASVNGALGSEARAELTRFLDYAKGVWDAAAPPFVFGSAPSVAKVLAMGPSTWWQLRRADPFRSMWAAIRQMVQSPHLRAIFARFATYNGSDPRRAPATLNCIAHVEMGLGGFGIEGGLGGLVALMVEACERLGVEIRTQSPVTRLILDRNRMMGVEIGTGEVITASHVVANADAAHVFGELLPQQRRRRTAAARYPSTSGWCGVLKAQPSEVRAPHTVWMPTPYLNEFRDLFERDQPPERPAVYICDQMACHGRTGWPDGRGPVFVMANAPAEPATGSRPETTWAALETKVLETARRAGLLASDDTLVWSRSPSELAARFPGSRGSLYGAASNDWTSAFRRPANQVADVPGLYLASGSAHPGGGVPLAMQSGRAAAQDVLRRLS
ncbi:MAG: phytoene desaturase family protein [Myxococcota bacterium]